MAYRADDAAGPSFQGKSDIKITALTAAFSNMCPNHIKTAVYLFAKTSCTL
jgi:hypothetical protein